MEEQLNKLTQDVDYMRLEEEKDEGKRKEVIKSLLDSNDDLPPPPVQAINLIEERDEREAVLKNAYSKIRHKIVYPSQGMISQTRHNFFCYHPPRYLLDLTHESGDIVCGNCGAVVMERTATSNYLEVAGSRMQADDQKVKYSPCISRFHLLGFNEMYNEDCRKIVADALAALDLEGDRMKYQVTYYLSDLASQLNVRWDHFVCRKQYRAHMAYGVFVWLMQDGCYRNPEKIAFIFDVSLKSMLDSENLHQAIDFWVRDNRNPPVIIVRPSQVMYPVCVGLNMSFDVSMVCSDIARDCEALSYGTSPEKLIYKIIVSVLYLLDPTHSDKAKMNKLAVIRDHLDLTESMATKAESLFISEIMVIKHMMNRQLV